ncbi:MAG: F0F1 ATP synthase subunit delta, partial [Acidobacteriota bacterium]
MSVTTIANRYARALADVITERAEMNEVVAELNGFAKMLGGHQQLRDVFASPVLSTERKRGVLGELLARMQLRQTSSNFLRVLLDNSRLHDLDQILKVLA